jgi:DNA ligase 1
MFMTLFAELVATSGRVAATASRLAKTRELAFFLSSLAPDEVPAAIAFLSGEMRQGRLGVAHAALSSAGPPCSGEHAALTVREVDAAFEELAQIAGPGSARRRAERLRVLFARATAAERDFLERLIVGELRQGALKGIMLDAVAAASGLPAKDVRRAAMSAGGIAEAACAALFEGIAGLARFRVRLMQPVLPMLSHSAESPQEALRTLGSAGFEWKLDGARIQVHKSGDEVRVYTRNLNDVTGRVPEIVTAVRAARCASLILDGEAIALRSDGSPLSFQLTMRRFGRRLEVESLRESLPLSVFFFDCLLADDRVLIDSRADLRFEALEQAVPPELVVPRIVTDEESEASAFFEAALARGHEGVMAKALDAPYEAGRRGASWLKVKRARTLDLVVLAAEWGHGRRSRWLSNLHLGARDPATGGYVMLGKTFKGLTDEMLQWQTEAFLKREVRQDGWIVHLRPEIVVEVAFNEIQESPQYPGGVALRFARVKGYRPDKRPEEADTIDTVHRLYREQAHAGDAGRTGAAAGPQ